MSSSIRFLPRPPAIPLPLLEPVPVLGGSGGFASSSLLLSAIDRLGGGSSRYCGIEEAVLDLERRAGFLLGIGGGAGLRRTWGTVRIVAGGLLDRMGRERVEAVEPLRRRSSSASRLPSKFAVWAAWVGKAGTMSFLADGFCELLWCALDAEIDELGWLKSTVRARCEPRAGGGSGRPPIRFTSTQSGSGLGVKGLLGRFGLGMWPSEGG
jgi:hypothetical protein